MLLLEPSHTFESTIFWGTHSDLGKIDALIQKVMDNVPFVAEQESPLLDFQNKIRESMAGKHESKLSWGGVLGGSFSLYGASFLWPELMVNIGLLRDSMAYMNSSRMDQGVMYTLESALEEGLYSIEMDSVESIMSRVKQVSTFSHDHLKNCLESRCLYLKKLPVSQRKDSLYAILESFHPMFSNKVRPRAYSVIPAEAFEGLVECTEILATSI